MKKQNEWRSSLSLALDKQLPHLLTSGHAIASLSLNINDLQ